jgi:hypothetical protein
MLWLHGLDLAKLVPAKIINGIGGFSEFKIVERKEYLQNANLQFGAICNLQFPG